MNILQTTSRPFYVQQISAEDFQLIDIEKIDNAILKENL